MEPIYIFGHRKPDTDSVSAAISLSYLKNQLGFKTIPVILSGINNETKFALDYFQVKEPNFLNDVKLKIKDTNYKKNYVIDEKESIYEAYQRMTKECISKIPVVGPNNHFLGILGMKDIAKDQINGDIEQFDTSYQNILTVLKGEEVLKFSEEIKGNLMVASYKSTRIIETIQFDQDHILIVGDRHSIIEYAVKSKIKLLILTGNSSIKEEHLELARQNKVNVIRTQLDTLHVSRIINLCNYVRTISTNNHVLCIDENDNLSDFIDIANKTKYSYYPVVKKDGACLGLIRLSDTGEKKKKKVILVDHNSIAQTVEGIEEAEIIEVVDHHNIGNIATTFPINFRNMPVGSTNTIIYQLYLENKIEIPKEIAGMMMSGIISDTLLLKSPTTTKLDEETLHDLGELTGINYIEYGLKMLKAGASLKGKTKEELLYTDFKIYPTQNGKMGIGQISTINPEEILDEVEEYAALIETIAQNNEYELLTLFVVNILNNGSYVIYNEHSKRVLEDAFNIPELYQGYYLKDIVSRKLQVLPAILEVVDKK